MAAVDLKGSRTRGAVGKPGNQCNSVTVQLLEGTVTRDRGPKERCMAQCSTGMEKIKPN